MKFTHAFLVTFLATPSLWARPLITEEVQPTGKLNFEAGTTFSYRRDSFGTPTTTYETVVFPVEIKFGVHPKADIGLDVTHFSHKLKLESNTLDGSSSANLSPSFKISPSEFFGIRFIWHAAQSESSDDEMPIGRGDDVEFLQMFKIPTPHGAAHLNTGYLWRGAYDSRLGVRSTPKRTIEPGNIFEARAAYEIPAFWNINLLSELAYYSIKEQRINGISTPNTQGEALDALAGLTWAQEGWTIGMGVAFGLLEERHTSFNLERGAGDWKGIFHISYKLSPRKPE